MTNPQRSKEFRRRVNAMVERIMHSLLKDDPPPVETTVALAIIIGGYIHEMDTSKIRRETALEGIIQIIRRLADGAPDEDTKVVQ